MENSSPAAESQFVLLARTMKILALVAIALLPVLLVDAAAISPISQDTQAGQVAYQSALTGPPTHFVNVSKQTVYLVVQGEPNVHPLEPNHSILYADVEAVWSRCSSGTPHCIESNGHWMEVYKLGSSLDLIGWTSAVFTTYTAQGTDDRLVILAGSSDCLGGCGWIEAPPQTEWPRPFEEVPYVLVSCSKHLPIPPEDSSFSFR